MSKNLSKKNKALEMLRSGRASEGEALLLKLARKNPKDHEIWHLLVSIKGQQGKFGEVVQLCQKALDYIKQDAGIYTYLGNAQASLGNAQGALESFNKAIEIQPDDPRAHNNLGNTLYLLGRIDEAIASFQRALKYNPNYAQALHSLGSVLLARGNTKDAAKLFHKATELEPEWIDAKNKLANSLRLGGELEKALDAYNDTLLKEKTNSVALSGKANIFLRQGKREESLAILEELANRKLLTPLAIETYAYLCRHFDKCREVIEIANGLLQYGRMDNNDRSTIYFSLGYMHDADGNYDQAFKDYQSANELLNYKYNNEEYSGKVSQIISTFSSDNKTKLPKTHTDTDRPIFIIGMPRSGTSLIEQILASHSDVYGAGELLEMNRLAASLPKLLGTDEIYPDCVRLMTDETVDLLARQYLDYLDGIAPESFKRVTDKLPTNFINLGLIALMFPNARVIHCQRHPLDTCLSIYFQNFSAAHSYSTNLQNIAHNYCEYRRLMEHWSKVLEIRIYDIEYEVLTSDFENEVRELIAFCGLEWEENCLKFFDSERQVSTASFDQVRKPVYRQSVERWKNYEAHVEDIKKILAPFL